jgi:hypothetical protein
MTSLIHQTYQFYFGICTVGGEGSSNVQGIWMPFLLLPDSLTSVMNKKVTIRNDADISAVQVQDTYRRLLAPSCRHDLAHDHPLPEDLGNWYQQ